MKDAAIDALEEILRKAKEYEFEPLKAKLKAKVVTLNPEEEKSDTEETSLPEKLSDEGAESHGEEGVDDDLVEKLIEALK